MWPLMSGLRVHFVGSLLKIGQASKGVFSAFIDFIFRLITSGQDGFHNRCSDGICCQHRITH